MNCKDCMRFNVCEKAKNPENYAIPECKDYKEANHWVEYLENGVPLYDEEYGKIYSCSNCYGTVIKNRYNYCPWCGKEMNVEG